MKTKILLLWIMLSGCIPGLKAETIFRLTLTDVPDGLELNELYPSISFTIQNEWGGEYEQKYSLSHEEGSNSYILNSETYPEIGNQTEGTLFISGNGLMSPTPVTWKMTEGQKEQNLEYSLKDFQRYTLSPDEGWMFWKSTNEQTVFLPAIVFGNIDDGSIYWHSATGNQTVPINETEYHIYALPGSYFWYGTLYKSDGSKEIRITEETVTFDAENPNVTLTVDWDNRTEITTKTTGIEEDMSLCDLSLNNEKNWINTSLGTTLLLHRGETYQWHFRNSLLSQYSCFIPPHTGSFTPTENQAELTIDFSDCTKNQIELVQDLKSLHAKNAVIEITDGNGYQEYVDIYNISSPFPVYLPKNNTFNIEYSFTLLDKDSLEWATYPFAQELTNNQEEHIIIRTSDFHKVSFIYDNQAINSWISSQKNPHEIKRSASVIYMPNGEYHAEADHPVSWNNMECDFTVNGEDRIIDYETMANNFKNITISIKNTNLIPSDIEEPYADFIFTKGEYGETYNLSVDLKEGSGTILLPKDTFTYQMTLGSSEGQIITLPLNDTLAVTDETRDLVLDIDTFDIVSLQVKDENGNLLPSFYCNLNYKEELLKKLKTPCYFAAYTQLYRLRIFNAGYEVWEKPLRYPSSVLNAVTLKKAEKFPIFIIPEDLKDWETANINVEGIGSYTYSNETGIPYIPLSFMQVAAGTYNVTVSADGYETLQGKIVVDRSLCPEGCSEIIYKFSMENGFTGVRNVDETGTLEIHREGANIVIDSETDCHVQIYTLSGICVANLKGKNIRSKALTPGIYLVLASNAQGTFTKRIIIGH